MKRVCILSVFACIVLLTVNASAQKNIDNYPEGFPPKAEITIGKLYPGVRIDHKGSRKANDGAITHTLGFSYRDTTVMVTISEEGEILKTEKSIKVLWSSLPAEVKKTAEAKQGDSHRVYTKYCLFGTKNYYTIVYRDKQQENENNAISHFRIYNIDSMGKMLHESSIDLPPSETILE